MLSKPCGRDYWNCNKSDTSGVNRFPKKLVTALRENKFPDLSQKSIYDVESLLTVSIATLVPEIKIKAFKNLWTDRKTIEFIQLMERPSRKCNNSNAEVERVNCINVKYKFHKGLKNQKIYF